MVESIRIDYEDLERDVIDRYLINTVFHCTFEEKYESILNNGAIKSSRKHQLTRPNGKSYHSYAYNNDCVALFDLRNIDKQSINFKTVKEFMVKNGYYFILKNDLHGQIILNSDVEYNNDTAFHIPEYECWYKDEIKLDFIEKILYIKKKLSEEEKMTVKEYIQYKSDRSEPICLYTLQSKYEKENDIKI